VIYRVDEPVRGAGGRTLHDESDRRIRVEGGMQIMKRVMVRYKVKADRAAENENYISKVFEQLKKEPPVAVDLKEVGSYRFFGE
jgi:hypothetical protein